nr:PREDICTED: uncharacterized protein LOC103355812 [Stegastes partitus]
MWNNSDVFSSLAHSREAAQLRSEGVAGNPVLAGGILIGTSLLGLLTIIWAFWYQRSSLSVFTRAGNWWETNISKGNNHSNNRGSSHSNYSNSSGSNNSNHGSNNSNNHGSNNHGSNNSNHRNPVLAGGILVVTSLLGLLTIIWAFWYQRSSLSVFKGACLMSFTCRQINVLSVEAVHSSVITLLSMDAVNLIAAMILGTEYIRSGCYNSITLPQQYRFINISLSWHEAQRFCRVKFADLATVNNMDDKNKLVNALRGRVTSTWIGLHTGASYRWMWADGSGRVGFTKWNDGEPNHASADEWCAETSSTGTWNDASCAEEKNFVCYERQHNGKPKFVFYSEQKSWESSLELCRDKHTDMAYARTEEENSEIMNMVKTWTGFFGVHNTAESAGTLGRIKL